ncbi:MAG: NAD(P)/FAD-dependent oxidoreductase [Novosphingobium sp.]
MVEPAGTLGVKVGIVGAGIAGLSCARRLARHGFAVALFDKGKRPGGRLSSLQLDDRAWDFGAPYLRQGSGAFAAQVMAWRAAGVLAPWPSGPAGALVGVPAMASLVTALAEECAVRFGTQITRLGRAGGRWTLAGPDVAAGPFDMVVLAIPAEQAAPLLSLHDLAMAREAAAIRSRPCWTVMAAFAGPVAAPDVLSDAAPLAWAARESTKPGRAAGERWVLQADAAWSAAHLDHDAPPVAEALLAAFAGRCAAPLPATTFLKAHRWRFAVPHGHTAGPLWNPRLGLGACGDWCAGPDIAGAWTAGHDLAGQVIAAHADARASQAVLAR